MQNQNQKRIDLLYLENESYKSYQKTVTNFKKLNLGTLYIKVNLKTLSETRAQMILNDFTTRLFVTKIDGQTEFYIYGKKKGKKGTFNEHCKNSFYEYNNKTDFFKHIILVSSNKDELLISDSKQFLEVAQLEKRDFSIYEK